MQPLDHDVQFTLIATVRNEAGTIATFVDSLLAQSRQPDEIVIVDGKSTDGTHEILSGYAADGKIVVISEDCNIAKGRNLGIARASHDFIAVTDAGCVVEPDWLKNIARCFAQNPNVDVVAANFRFETHSDFEKAVVLSTFAPDREESDKARYYPSSRSVAFLKSAWADAKGYPEWLYAAEDTLFNIRLREIGKEFVFCRDAIVCWRPRTTWRALAKQRFNFARGNARVGISLAGYRKNIRIHLLILLPLLGMPLFPPFGLVALGALLWHVRNHLWHQASEAARRSGRKDMLWRVMLVMEWVRLSGIAGFLAGRLDRRRDPKYVAEQKKWMGVESVE